MRLYKYLLRLSICFLMVTCFSSCIKMGLEDLPTYSDAKITSFKFEYRYKVAVGTSSEKMQVRDLTTKLSVDDKAKTVTCTITVPGVHGTFSSEEKANVSLSNIVGIASISTAATIVPVNGAPKLGYISDFSAKTFQYEVIAADGKTKEMWTLVIQSFVNE